VKITTSGKITIPHHIREALGLLPGTEVEWEMRAGEAVLRKVPDHDPSAGRVLVERMRGRGTVPMSTDEIMALMRPE
jgi:AbrB family looped-hinge helix DNA binding protein